MLAKNPIAGYEFNIDEVLPIKMSMWDVAAFAYLMRYKAKILQSPVREIVLQ